VVTPKFAFEDIHIRLIWEKLCCVQKLSVKLSQVQVRFLNREAGKRAAKLD
jgi:hypothetical protein